MKQRKLIVFLIIVFSTLLSSFLFYGYQILSSPNVRVERSSKKLLIPTGTTYKELQKKLVQGDYVNDIISFSFLAKLMKYQDHVKPGLYLLTSNMTNREAIGLLRRGEQTPVRVTFNNLRYLKDIPGKMTNNLELDSATLAEFILNDSVQAAYGFDQQTFMSMFIPNTYEFYWDVSKEKLVSRMKEEYDRFWNEKRLKKAEEIGLSPLEVTTLASIVESETKVSDEAPIIAGVYMNRLSRNMLLQADPTVIHAHGDYDIRRVLNKHIKIDSPYNTYKYTGLPPGPIYLASIKTLDAVLNYERHNFLYFCAKEDFSGRHNFAKTLSQHNRNAAIYQRALNRAGILQ